MIKFKLIENTGYYSLRSKYIFLLIFPPMIIALLVNYYFFSVWLLSLLAFMLIVSLWATKKYQKKIKEYTDKHYLIFQPDAIVIQTQQGQTKEKFHLKDLDRVALKQNYEITAESENKWMQELKGNHLKNFIEFINPEGKKRFDFEIESHYQLTQLEKIITSWKNKDLTIEYI